MEEKLAEYRKKLDEVEVPMELLDEAIELGLKKAKLEKKKRPKRIWLLSVAMVAIVLVGFSGIGKIMELIQHDKGLVSAVENAYYEELGISEMKNGLEFVINGVIADEMGLVLFYTIKADKKQTNIGIESIDLKGLDGGKVNPGTISFGGWHDEINSKKSSSGVLEFFFQEPLTAREFQLDIGIEGESVRADFSIAFELKKEIQKKKVYPLNETVVIEGQKIILNEAIVYPLRVAIEVELAPDNTKEILEFEDIRLVDENGEVWSKITSGTTKSGTSEEGITYYFQSNYFKDPGELYLAFSKIQAVDKEFSSIVVDTEQKKILKQPQGNKLRDLDVRGGWISMNFYTEEEFPYGLFIGAVDANGNAVDTNSNSISSRIDDSYAKMGIGLENLNSHPNPISLKLAFFPEWIIGNEKIRIK